MVNEGSALELQPSTEEGILCSGFPPGLVVSLQPLAVEQQTDFPSASMCVSVSLSDTLLSKLMSYFKDC